MQTEAMKEQLAEILDAKVITSRVFTDSSARLTFWCCSQEDTAMEIEETPEAAEEAPKVCLSLGFNHFRL